MCTISLCGLWQLFIFLHLHLCTINCQDCMERREYYQSPGSSRKLHLSVSWFFQLHQMIATIFLIDWNDLVNHWLNVKPTLLWVTKSLNMDIQTAMDILALLGIGLSSLAIITRFARNFFVFGALWVLYLSFYSVSLKIKSYGAVFEFSFRHMQVGSVFLWFQWYVKFFCLGRRGFPPEIRLLLFR